MSRRRSGALRWLVFLLIVVAPFVMPAAAQAHALLDLSTPADGATYDRSPREVQLTFSEDVQVSATSVQLFDSSGRTVAVGTPASASGENDASDLVVPLNDLAKDRYLLRWRTVSSDDLHPVSGSLVFGIATAVTAVDQEATSGWDRAGTVIEAVLRWIALMALGFALAARLISRRLSVSGETGQAMTPVLPRTTTVLAGVGTLAASALGLFYLVRLAEFAGFEAVITSWQVTMRLIAGCGAALVAWLILRLPYPADRRAALSWWPSGLLVLAIAAITSTGHPASAGPLVEAVGALHSVTTMVWCCGAAVVAVAAIPAIRRADRRRAATIAGAFTPIALVALPISLVTGFLLAGRLLPSVGALMYSDYGHALLVKLGLLAFGLLCSAGTLVFLVLGRGRRRAALVIGAEAVVLMTVVLAASSLAATRPASQVVWAPAPEQAPTTGVLSAFANDLVVTLDVGPARPGRNFVTVGVLDTRRPAPAPVADVRVALGDEPAVTAVPQGDFRWLSVATIPKEGPASFTVRVERPGESTVVVPFSWTVGPVAGTRMGGSTFAPLAIAGATLVGLVVLVALLAWGLARRRSLGSHRRSEQDEPTLTTVDS
jgi:copper transport protein